MSYDFSRSFQRELHPPNPRADAATRGFHWACLSLFLAAAAGRAVTLPLASADGGFAWLDALVILLGLTTTLLGQSQRLAAQNVLFSAAVIMVMSGIVFAVGARTGVPFGALTYTDQCGLRLLGTVPWLLPCLWPVILLNARGVARLALRPWRKTRRYGYWVIALTALQTLLFALALEPHAGPGQRYWLWQHAQSPFTWFGAPWVNFLAWTLTALLMLAFVTPFLINKKPAPSPPFFHPLIVWLALAALLAFAAALEGAWLALTLNVGANSVLLLLSLRGARWAMVKARAAEKPDAGGDRETASDPPAAARDC